MSNPAWMKKHLLGLGYHVYKDSKWESPMMIFMLVA